MKHLIIVKWNESVSDKAEMKDSVEKLFSAASSEQGVHKAEIISNCVDRTNRYDLIIALTMDKNNLELWDGCELHGVWKEEFGKYIASKAIFDME